MITEPQITRHTLTKQLVIDCTTAADQDAADLALRAWVRSTCMLFDIDLAADVGLEMDAFNSLPKCVSMPAIDVTDHVLGWIAEYQRSRLN